MKSWIIVLFFAFVANSFAASTDGTIVSITRKANPHGGATCGGEPVNNLIWLKLKPASGNGDLAFAVAANSDIGKQVLSIALTAITSGLPVKIYHGTNYTTCTGTDYVNASVYSLDEIILNPL